MKILISAVLSVLALNANSTLIDRGNGLIYDEDLNITWLQDANYAFTSGFDPDGKLSWDDALNWTANLTYGEFNDWRLPSSADCIGLNCTASELGHLYYSEGITATSPGPFINLAEGMHVDPLNDWFWTSDVFVTPNSYAFRFADGRQDIRFQGDTNSAWAVHDGDIGAVPTPATVWLIGLGLGLIGFARRKA